MTGDDKNKMSAKSSGKPEGADRPKDPSKQRDPDWAVGLKQLYDSVVEESLPDSIKDLLSKLDTGKS